MAIKVLITDDHNVVRQGLRMVLALDPELEVVGGAENGGEALRLAMRLGPDVVLMDLVMPVRVGVGATRAIPRVRPATQGVALTSFREGAWVTGGVRG